MATPSLAAGVRLRAATPQTALAAAGALLVWALLLTPLGTLVAHSPPAAVGRVLGAPGALDPLWVSLGASAVALGVIVACGTPLGWLLARDRLPFPRMVEGGLLCPLLMPPLVIGLLLVYMVGPATPVGGWLQTVGVSATNTFLAVVIAEVYEAAPYYVLGVQAAVAQVDPELEVEAELLGDGAVRRWRRVTLPLAAPGLASALSVAWARAIGAFGAVIIVAYHPFGLPLQIWTSLQETGLGSALPYACLLVGVALPLPIAAYAWSARARRRR